MNRDASACQAAAEKFGDKAPDEACEPVSEMYLIASSDLIGKYYWLSFFGTGTGDNYIQLPFSGNDQQGNLVYGNGLITLGSTADGQVVALLNVPEQGIRNAFVSDVVIYQNGEEQRYNYANVTNKLEGMIWVDPGFGSVTYMSPAVRDSVFTNLYFFDGEGLENYFEQVFANGEVKIYKVKFDPVL
jgi:hypothetical protein